MNENILLVVWCQPLEAKGRPQNIWNSYTREFGDVLLVGFTFKHKSSGFSGEVGGLLLADMTSSVYVLKYKSR